MSIEFKEWPKIARLNRNIVVTEKIDGTNAAIGVVESQDGRAAEYSDVPYTVVRNNLLVYAQSRSRLITPDQDNHGFAKWVWANAEALVETLGVGLHFGEWWGSGINRGYGLQKGEKRFSLFNTPRYGNPDKFNLAPLKDIGVDTVPVLWEGQFDQETIKHTLHDLETEGSYASPGFMDPEGVVVFHTAAQTAFKVTIKNDEVPKGAVHS